MSAPTSPLVPAAASPGGAPADVRGRPSVVRLLLWAVGVFALVSAVRVLTGAHDVDSAGTLAATLVAAVPIALAGLGGLWSERAGVVNIGLEGMLIMGTLGAGYFGYNYGVVAGVLGGLFLGLLTAAVHALATVIFGVDHIVSGVALNIIAPGLSAFLAKALFSNLEGGGPTQSPPLDSAPSITIAPIADQADKLAAHHWFLVSDLASIVGALTRGLSTLTILALVLVFLTGWVLWKTPFGLRLRSVGESPSAAESLGVNVYRYKIVAVLISGALAGVGGAYLATVSSSGYQNGMTNGIGYIGLAAMIFGNWRPTGMLVGATLFGYARTLQLRGGSDSLHALLLVIAILLALVAVLQWRNSTRRQAVVTVAFGAVFLLWFLTTSTVP